MHVQTLASGSAGNSYLVRAGDVNLLVDAGLTLREFDRRFEKARFSAPHLDHIALTHGHLDHARSAGSLARRHDALLHCCEALMSNASVRAAPRMARLSVGSDRELTGERGPDRLRLRAIEVPHDAEPTVAFRLEHEERVAVFLTDIGNPRGEVAKALHGAHLLVLEFNHDLPRLLGGPYPPQLKRRVSGDRGHLSNDQAAGMLPHLAGEQLHTLVLAHISETNNSPELARRSAERALAEIGRSDVEIVVASQYEPGPNLPV
jgi:phosphoribosyl 1,2-cyclic phosphodiesterase